MSNPQYPQQQPGWGSPQQPGYGAPQFPPQPPKKSRTGKIIGFGCLGIVGLVVLIAVIGALASGGDTDSGSKSTTKTAAPATTGKEDAGKKTDSPEPAQEPASPVKITARKTAFTKTILADSSNYTSVQVTIANNGDDKISVNPLYFTITDTNGTKHTAELAVDEKQIDTVELAHGENVTGTITGKGTFTPKYLTYTDGLIGDSQRAKVS